MHCRATTRRCRTAPTRCAARTTCARWRCSAWRSWTPARASTCSCLTTGPPTSRGTATCSSCTAPRPSCARKCESWLLHCYVSSRQFSRSCGILRRPVHALDPCFAVLCNVQNEFIVPVQSVLMYASPASHRASMGGCECATRTLIATQLLHHLRADRGRLAGQPAGGGAAEAAAAVPLVQRAPARQVRRTVPA